MEMAGRPSFVRSRRSSCFTRARYTLACASVQRAPRALTCARAGRTPPARARPRRACGSVPGFLRVRGIPGWQMGKGTGSGTGGGTGGGKGGGEGKGREPGTCCCWVLSFGFLFGFPGCCMLLLKSEQGSAQVAPAPAPSRQPSSVAVVATEVRRPVKVKKTEVKSF